jgi:hypothetical protein
MNEKEKRTHKTEEMKKTLALQLDEKKKKEELDKNYDNKFSDIINSNLQKYNTEINSLEKNKREKIKEYKQELDKQLQEKTKNKQIFMVEAERGINRELINEIMIEKKNNLKK